MFTPSQRGRPFCSRECYYESKRGHRKDNVAYRMVTAKGHPIAPSSGVVSEARLNLWERIGPGPHACHWCEHEVDWRPGDQHAPDALIADHLNWDTTNDSADNLVPSCNTCNSHRRKAGVTGRKIQPGEDTVIQGGNRTRAVKRQCLWCNKEFLVAPSTLNHGGGLYCSRSCAGKGKWHFR